MQARDRLVARFARIDQIDSLRIVRLQNMSIPIGPALGRVSFDSGSPGGSEVKPVELRWVVPYHPVWNALRVRDALSQALADPLVLHWLSRAFGVSVCTLSEWRVQVSWSLGGMHLIRMLRRMQQRRNYGL